MIITVSREFGSGGRELGKRLSEALDISCYDKEIIALIAKEHGFDEQYVARFSEKRIQAAYPLTIGHRLTMTSHPMAKQAVTIAVEQRKIIEGFAKQGDCVIVGRCADVILRDMHPFKVFVYADEAAKINRCMTRAEEGESLNERELRRRIRQIDKERAAHHDVIGDTKWGAKEGYDLCVNTSGREIKALVPALAKYIRRWFDRA